MEDHNDLQKIFRKNDRHQSAPMTTGGCRHDILRVMNGFVESQNRKCTSYYSLADSTLQVAHDEGGK